MLEKDLYDKIRDGEFHLSEPMPVRPVKPALGKGHDSNQAKQYAEALSFYEQQMKAYRDEVEKRGKMDRDLRMKFKREAFKYCGIEDHEKRHRAWEMAWEHGHSAGYNDVLLHLEELSELLI